MNEFLNKHEWAYQLVIWSITGGMLLAIAAPFVGWSYTQRYIADDNNTTATKGIFMQKTVYLKEYKHLGNGNGLFGTYNRYSRSDRHTDVLSIYK